MKKNIILLGALVISSVTYAQVGINNEAPKATLDVTAKTTDNTTAEGIIAPRLSGDDIKGKDGQYLADQKGAIVYAISAVGTPSVKTANITTEGYYYFDGALWTKFGSGTATVSTEPWNVQGGITAATTNAQNIYQAGNVSIGSQTPIAPFTSNSITITPKLSVTGDVATTGSYYTTTGKYADYVFEDYFDGASKIDETYKFKSLEETAAYIKENKHLPGVTSIKDILKTDNGYTVNLSELSIQQLEKIEELYLHTIEQQEEIANQKTEINDLRSRMEKLEQLLVKENNNK